MKRTPMDLQKKFPDKPCVIRISGDLSLRLSIPRERLSIPPGFWKGGKNAGWLGTWDSPLRTDSASFKSLESFIQLTSFCGSWILLVSSRIVSRSSTRFPLETVSNVDPWTRFNSSISWRLFIWASRRSRFCSNTCSWRSSWSRRSCSSLATIWSISLRWDSIIPFNFWVLLLSESAWNSCFWISVLTSAIIRSFCLSKRILILLSPMSRLDFRFWHELSSKTGLPVLVWTNLLRESDELVSGSLVLLAPEWTVVKIALCRWSRRWAPRHTSRRAPNLYRRIHPGRSLQKSLSSRSCRGAWAHNLWEDCISPRGNTPHCACVQWFWPSAVTTLKMVCRTENK